MKNPPIWESASRPMFVKSVWLEAGHRHFILDYEPRQTDESGANQRSRREPIQTSGSCDFPQMDDELLLVGSAKTPCQQNFTQAKSMKYSTENCRRFSSRKMFMDHFRRSYDLMRDEAASKRSSVYDINSVMTSHSQSDEKLAERVLNWLDLAGKMSFFPTAQETERKKVKKERVSRKLQDSVCTRRPDSVKHITIIFNKEGVPVRLNRPARNIDLCTVTSSAGAVRRLAGNLASARLYEDGVNGETKSATSGERGRPRPKTTCAGKSTMYSGSGRKKGSRERETSAMRDTKRQLHIFMPSLPKKTPVSEETVCSDLTNQCTISST